MSQSDVNAQFAATVPSLLANRKNILSDNVLRNTPVAVDNNLAFLGRSLFKGTTYGTYLQWWSDFAAVSTDTDENGVRWYIYRIAGSPFSGNNECCWVSESGQTRVTRVEKFLPVWRSFLAVLGVKTIRVEDLEFSK